MTDVDLILASQSPRRRELLEQIGVRFAVDVADVPEVYQPDETPYEYVQRLAITKAKKISLRRADSIVVLGSDTIGVCNGQVLEKPESLDDAKSMINLMTGTSHQVISAVALVSQEKLEVNVSETLVTFKKDIPDSVIEAYWATGEPQDKSGSYAIQGLGAVFVEAIQGSYSNVVGLPIEIVAPMLERFDVPIWHVSKQQK
jgi:septum formation protein